MKAAKIGFVAFVIAGAFAVLPGSAAAWGPAECAEVHWNHPDCNNVPRPTVTVCVNGVTQEVPADMVPGESTPGECVTPPAPPVQPPVTPPVTPPVAPPVSTPAPVTPPVTTVPDVPPVAPKQEKPKADIGSPVHVVEGKEQQKPNSLPREEARPVSTTATLPFTGQPIVPMVVLGSLMLLGGMWYLRRSRFNH